MRVTTSRWHSASPWRSVLLLGGAALLLSALEAAQLSFRASVEGWVVTVPSLALRALASWFTLAAIIPGVLWVTARRPLWRLSASRLILHAMLALVFTALHMAAAATLMVAFDQRHPWTEVLEYLMVAYAAIDVVLYCTVVGAWHAWQGARLASDRAIANARLEQQLQAAQLEALRGQLNPHFLFNTLHAISAIALKGDGVGTADAIGNVSELLRDAIRPDAPPLHSLDAELELVSRYASILSMRFPSLRVTSDVADAARNAQVPYMILQPLVENAAKHGAGSGSGQADIRIEAHIEARREADTVVLTVIDAGDTPRAEAQPGTGVGLANTRARIQALFGDAGGVELQVTPLGARATLRIPHRPDARA